MTHVETIDAFADHAAGTLTFARRAQVEQHLAECASCRSAYALLRRALEPGPVPQRLTADPFLPTRIRALAEHHAGARRWAPAMRWSVALAAALVLGMWLGRELPTPQRSAASSSDVVEEFASSLAPADLSDQWYLAVEADGGTQP